MKVYQSLIFPLVAMFQVGIGLYQNSFCLMGTGSLLLISSVFLYLSNKKRINSGSSLQNFADDYQTIIESSRELYSASESLKKVVSEENQAVSQSSSALEEISAMLGRTAQSAGQLASMSQNAKVAVEDGRTGIGQLLKGLGDINLSTEKLSTRLEASLSELEKVTLALSKIKEKAGLIDEIVFQTKLLSFNASVEAARAGEQGKGFAVVAEEMGSLAASSGRASKEISDILKSSLDSTYAIVSAMKIELTKLMNESKSDVLQGMESGKKGTAAFEKIVNEVDSVAHMSTEISSATEQQDIGVKEVTQAIHTLQSTSQQLGQVAEKTLKTALSLSAKSEVQKGQLVDIGRQIGFSVVMHEKPFDFDAAISAHLDWKMKLSRYLEKPDGSLDPDKVCLDSACALGKWIYGDGQAFKKHTEFSNLRSAHGEFHKTAAEVISMINDNRIGDAQKLLSPGGKYLKTSDYCVGLIRILKSDLATDKNSSVA